MNSLAITFFLIQSQYQVQMPWFILLKEQLQPWLVPIFICEAYNEAYKGILHRGFSKHQLESNMPEQSVVVVLLHMPLLCVIIMCWTAQQTVTMLCTSTDVVQKECHQCCCPTPIAIIVSTFSILICCYYMNGMSIFT